MHTALPITGRAVFSPLIKQVGEIRHRFHVVVIVYAVQIAYLRGGADDVLLRKENYTDKKLLINLHCTLLTQDKAPLDQASR